MDKQQLMTLIVEWSPYVLAVLGTLLTGDIAGGIIPDRYLGYIGASRRVARAVYKKWPAIMATYKIIKGKLPAMVAILKRMQKK